MDPLQNHLMKAKTIWQVSVLSI